MKTVMKDHLIHLLSICILMSGYSVSASNFMQAQLVQGDMMAAERSDTLKTPLVNQKDKHGRKQGLWIERDGLKEIYYRDGLRDGVAKTYFVKTGKLEVLGWFERDKPTGNWYYFDESSRLFATEQGITANEFIKVDRGDGTLITPEFQSYYKVYHKNGTVKEEGKVLYNESIEVGDFFRLSLWKYYDSEGKLVKEVNHKTGN